MVFGRIKQTGIPKKRGLISTDLDHFLCYCTKDYIELKTQGLPSIPLVGGDMT